MNVAAMSLESIQIIRDTEWRLINCQSNFFCFFLEVKKGCAMEKDLDFIRHILSYTDPSLKSFKRAIFKRKINVSKGN